MIGLADSLMLGVGKSVILGNRNQDSCVASSARSDVSGSEKAAEEEAGFHPSVFRYDFREQPAKANDEIILPLYQ